MTRSAPRDRTISTFAVLHTPVTCAPNALAICTANVPTPPEAPMTSTLCPRLTCARSRTACRAVRAEIGAGGGLREGEVARFGCELVRPGAGVPGEGALRDAEHVLANARRGHVLADRLDAPGDLPAPHAVLGRAEPVAG